VKITMSVTLAPELTEAIRESAERQGLSFDDWIAAAAEVKFRADAEAEIFEEAERKRRAAALQEYLDEYQAEFGAFTEEEMAAAEKRRLEAHRRAEESWARKEAEGAEILKTAEHERRMRGLGQFFDEWEAEHGAFTDEEMARASRELGLPWPPEGRGA
jgi:hemerythrin